jgi:hypothetical protein
MFDEDHAAPLYTGGVTHPTPTGPTLVSVLVLGGVLLRFDGDVAG